MPSSLESINFQANQPAPGESLHSFVLRLSIKYGIYDFNHILIKSNWRLVPKISQDLSFIHERLPSSVWESLVRSSCGFTSRLARIADVTLHTENFLTYYSNRAESTKSCFAVLFCKQCFESQVKQYGFSFFKAEWHFKNKCSIHNAELLRFHPKGGSSKVSKQIKKLLSLRFDEASIYHSEKPLPDGLSLAFTQKLWPCNIAIAPCAEKFLHRSLIKLNRFPSGYYDLVDHSKLFTAYQKAIIASRQRDLSEFYWRTALDDLSESDFGQLKSELSRYVQTIYTDPETQLNPTIKAKDVHCDRCDLTTFQREQCVHSKAIKVVSMTDGNTYLYKEGHCSNLLRYVIKGPFRARNSEIINKAIAIHHEERDRVVGESTWSAFKENIRRRAL